MTLTEYLNQTEPVKMPKVVLQESEITKQISYKSGIDKITHYSIPDLWERFKIGSTYLQINNNPELFSTDSDGNKKSLSCFCLPS